MSEVVERSVLPLFVRESGAPEPARIRVIVLFLGGVLLLISASVAVAYRRVRRRLHPRSMGLVFVRTLLAGVLLLLVANLPRGGGVVLPLSVAALALASWVGWQLLQRSAAARFVLQGGFWLGLVYLCSSGVALLFPRSPSSRIAELVDHSLFGFLWVPFLIVFALDHIARHPGARRDKPRATSLWLGVSLVLVLVSGIGHVLLGQQALFDNTLVHQIGAAGMALALGAHLWQHRERLVFASPAEPFPASGLPFPSALAVSAVLVGAFVASHYAPSAPERALAQLAEERPMLAEAMSSEPGAAFPAAYLNEEAASHGCGALGGCHSFATRQWAASAHRHSANAAYRRAVRLLVAQQGSPPARFCARCHDPVSLWSGAIGADAPYPDSPDPEAGSEGVTCVVCHSVRPHAEVPRNGRYGLDARPLEAARVGHPFTSYMLVKDDAKLHKRAWTPPTLDQPQHCAGCHELTVNGVPLRRTVSEWRDGPFGPGGAELRSCVDCHAPETGQSHLGDFAVHDHSFRGGNVAVAGAAGDLDATRAFIADALRLEASLRPDGASRRTLELRLHNTGVGHAFPTAPKDLVRYWFEYRWDGGSGGWQRLHEGSLFDEILSDREDRELAQHEIWKVFHVTHRGAAIPPGSSRLFSYELPASESAEGALHVRLMHQRFKASFIDAELQRSPLFLGPIEITAVATSLAPAPGAAGP